LLHTERDHYEQWYMVFRTPRFGLLETARKGKAIQKNQLDATMIY